MPNIADQLKALAYHVSAIHNAIDNGKPGAAKRFTRTFARWVKENSYHDTQIWNIYNGLDKYSFPGAYPLFYIDGENSVLCPACATKALSDYICPKFRPIACDANLEDTELFCDSCSSQIESAYGEQDQDGE
jgi:hypothetical protein